MQTFHKHTSVAVHPGGQKRPASTVAIMMRHYGAAHSFICDCAPLASVPAPPSAPAHMEECHPIDSRAVEF